MCTCTCEAVHPLLKHMWMYMLHLPPQISMDTTLNPVFMTAIEMVDDETYLGADGRHLFICQKNRFNSQTCERECTYTYIQKNVRWCWVALGSRVAW